MCSAHPEVPAKVAIRDAAMELFAARGVKATTMRQIADAAEVSPALIVHHFKSKAGLQQAVDNYVVETFMQLMDNVEDTTVADLFGSPSAEKLDEMASQGGAQWAMLGNTTMGDYLRRLIADAEPAGTVIMLNLHRLSLKKLTDWASTGAIDLGENPAARTAMLIAHDMSTVLMRGPLTAMLGYDPLSHDGAARWAAETLSLYSGAAFPALADERPHPTEHTSPTQEPTNQEDA